MLKGALDVFARVLGMSHQRLVAREMKMPQPIALDGFRGRQQGLPGFLIGAEFIEAATPADEVFHVGILTGAQGFECPCRFEPLAILLVDDRAQLQHLRLQLILGGELVEFLEGRLHHS